MPSVQITGNPPYGVLCIKPALYWVYTGRCTTAQGFRHLYYTAFTRIANAILEAKVTDATVQLCTRLSPVEQMLPLLYTMKLGFIHINTKSKRAFL